jgi:hypothetical protein
MSISKEDRDSYEKGREEAKFIHENPLSYLISGGIHDRPLDSSKAEAYDKGLKEERFDDEK